MGAVHKIRQDAIADELVDAVLARLDERLKSSAKRLLNAREASEYLGMSVESIRRKVSARRIPIVWVDRIARFDIGDLNRWIEENKRFED